jgi:hypothetical protein
MKREQPEMMYVLLADLDHAQHALGAVADPSEWVVGPAPKLPKGCQQKPRYRLVSRRNTRLYKEPILDLIRDVDRAFGRLMVGLLKGGHLQDAAVVLVSDHNMVNYLYRDRIFDKTDVRLKLAKAGLATKKDFFLLGVGSVGLLYWRPEYKAKHPGVVAKARSYLLSAANLAHNHETGAVELPWAVMNRQDMQRGRADLGISARELYNDHFVRNGVWPDLAVVMQHGWQIPSGAFNIGGGAVSTAFNAGHGAPDTAAVMTAIWGLGFPAGVACSEAARLADVGATVARHQGTSLPDPLGRALTCTPK